MTARHDLHLRVGHLGSSRTSSATRSATRRSTLSCARIPVRGRSSSARSPPEWCFSPRASPPTPSVDLPSLARKVIADAGYLDGRFDARSCSILTSFAELPMADARAAARRAR